MRLRRIATTAHGVFGVLFWEGEPFAVTLEQPERENRTRESCIPRGTYLCKRVKSPRFGDTFEVLNVIGRTAILFHKGNTHKDTQGCVLVGEAFNVVDGLPGITYSGEGFTEFMKRTAGLTSFVLEVTD
jgi:hypothetical protein